jgi:spermidine/putrescine-binding protein
MVRSICEITTGIGMIADRVKQLAPDAAMDSWELLFKPENARRIAPCGITMMDSAIDVVPGVLKYLGRDPDSTRCRRPRRGGTHADESPLSAASLPAGRWSWPPGKHALHSTIPAT